MGADGESAGDFVISGSISVEFEFEFFNTSCPTFCYFECLLDVV